jgi:hypothetical protein
MKFFVGLIAIAIAASAYLLIRSWVDAREEKKKDIEIPRDGEEYLGSWANKNKKALIQFRLQRNRQFTHKMVEYPGNDTILIQGNYDIIGLNGQRRPDKYPRLIALNEKKDTILNMFIAYITPYDSKVEKIDRMVLSPNGIYDTINYTFYRIKQ